MSSYYPVTEVFQPSNIELVPMTQRLNIKNRKEDWTGKSDTALRRKLQNRLNQRASRLRRKQAENGTTTSNNENNVPNQFILPSNGPATTCYNPLVTHFYQQTLVQRPKLKGDFSLPQVFQDNLRRIPDATTFQYTPLPADHKLLTLMHFNLIRALCGIVEVLGLTLDDMHIPGLPSPFVDPAYQIEYETQYAEYANRKFFSGLPESLIPTSTQRTVPHHPKADCFPFPNFRDNLIIAYRDGTIDKGEFCMDVCYGVDDGSDPWEGKLEADDLLRADVLGMAVGAKTGFVVWSDPLLPSSWEVEPLFAQKYSSLFVGCNDVIASTNYWREMRGERPLEWRGAEQGFVVADASTGFSGF